MSAPPSLADRLVTACFDGDIPSAKAAIADGASVNTQGTPEHWAISILPLEGAVFHRRREVVAWLLANGASANAGNVMYYGACYCASAILQLLVDAGGDVNKRSDGRPPLYWALSLNRECSLSVLLSQPSLDVTAAFEGKTPEQYAADRDYIALADMITLEVGGGRGCRLCGCAVCMCVCLLRCVCAICLRDLYR